MKHNVTIHTSLSFCVCVCVCMHAHVHVLVLQTASHIFINSDAILVTNEYLSVDLRRSNGF